ncbi:SGNH/GDSL hydrolase family protein [Ideonella sp. DXS29W]|uniref:SGNH/GDSL hydrolase family protein n=1 Tax=Ideonella lacteola TaxID=2984193 RepID=A0ABU9BSZ3_9BURK
MRCFATLALTLGLALPAWSQATLPAPLRIMPVGDSITEGGDGFGGYRRPLFDKLTPVWGMPNFVGSRNMRQSDPADFVDHDEDGYSAYRIEQITSGKGFWNAPPIEERLKAWDPAVVLIHAGTNDAQQNYYFYGNPKKGFPGVVDRLDDLVSRVVAFNPSIYVVVAQIIPANAPASDTTQAYIRALNERIPALVARHQAQGHRVSMVDMYTPMLAHPNPDGIHPGPEGYAVMGEQWFQALMALGVVPTNPNPGRFWGLQHADRYSTSSSTPWNLQPNLVRAGASSLAGAKTTDYRGSHAPALLNDGSLAGFSNDADYTSTTTFTLATAQAPRGYDITRIRTAAGLPSADNGDERSHQAYEVWWSSVDAPDVFNQLADAHHILVNVAERASQITLTREDGAPMARGVAQVQFRFKQPPARQFGFIGIESPTPYRELEVFGAPTP